MAGTGPAPRYGLACLCGVLSKSPLSSRPLSSLSPPRSGALSSLPPHWQVRPGVGHHRGKGLMDWVSRTGLTEQETSLWGRPLREERDTRTNTRDGEPNGRRRAPFLSRAWPRSRSGSREPKGALCRVVPGGARRQLTKGRRRMPDHAVYPRFLFGAGPFLPLLLLEVTPFSPADPAVLRAISQPTRWCSPQQRCPGRHGVDFHGVLQRPVSHPGVRNPHSSQAGTHGDRARESLPSFLRQSLYSQRGCFELELCSAWHPVRCPVRNR